MTIRQTYSCDQCGCRFPTPENAMECERSKPQKPDINQGDTIEVMTRYDGYRKVKVLDLVLANRSGYGIFLPHEWVVIVDQVMKLGKDWYTDTIPLDYLKSSLELSSETA